MTWMIFLSFENLAESKQCKLADKFLTIIKNAATKEETRLQIRPYSSFSYGFHIAAVKPIL